MGTATVRPGTAPAMAPKKRSATASSQVEERSPQGRVYANWRSTKVSYSSASSRPRAQASAAHGADVVGGDEEHRPAVNVEAHGIGRVDAGDLARTAARQRVGDGLLRQCQRRDGQPEQQVQKAHSTPGASAATKPWQAAK